MSFCVKTTISILPFIFFLISHSAISKEPCTVQNPLLSSETAHTGAICRKSNEGFDQTAQACDKINEAYECSMSAAASARKKGVELQEKEMLSALREPEKFSQGLEAGIKTYYSKLAAKPFEYQNGHAEGFSRYIEKQFKSPLDGFRNMQLAVGFACNDSVASSECQKNFNSIMTLMRTNPNKNSLPDTWIRLGNNPKVVPAVSRLMLKVLEKFQAAKKGALDSTQSLFDDTQDSFRSCGGTKKDSDGENKPVFVAAGIIASMLSYIDHEALAHGKNQYSIPAEVKTECDYTRPYHFWLAAYLAHRLKLSSSKLDSLEKSNILEAVHVVDQIYEQFSKAGTKRDTNEVLKSETHDWYNVETQKNIAFNDVGAYWSLTRKSIDLDQAFLKMYNAASAPEKAGQTVSNPLNDVVKHLTGFDMDAVFNWRARLGSEEAYKSLPKLK